jgi:tetratricopeptide (TPR) repeat protein
MDLRRGFWVAVGLSWIGLAGCATQPVETALADAVWQDDVFGYRAARVVEGREAVFGLDETLRQSLASHEGDSGSTEGRIDRLVSRLYGPTGIRLSYGSGHTTGASQTWINQRGDCLSLTILAYAAAKHLGLPARMQEVRVPVLVDRRGGMDYVNEHVNLHIRADTEILLNGQVFSSGGFVIDFEPQPGARNTGRWLSENAILARYYNNRATEYLAQDDRASAYAYFRAAIRLAPDYAPLYTNLAHLYARHGLAGPAEQLLHHAIALGGPSYAPLRGMAQLLRAQGRDAEAQRYADLLAKRQDEDPYHWLGLGLDALRDGRHAAAISALEKASALTTGFEEIHYHLGLAYWRSGQVEAARKQLAALSAINSRDPGIAVLSKKLQNNAPQSAVF